MKVEFYSDKSSKTINMDLFSGHAEEWARAVCKSGLNDRGTLDRNKSSQIRKFYDDALRFSERLKAGDDYGTLLPYLKMLNAKAAYAEGRKLVTAEFRSFISQSLEYVAHDDPGSYDIFLTFFEAFMGYYKFFESQQRNY
jgi:CRISPR-associated protein Csm2